MLKDGMSLCNRCGRSTSGVECTNSGCQDALASVRLAAVTAERDAYLETIRATFRVLESRGQAPDDNAPLSVTVRRVLDFLDTMTSERDALAAQLAALKKRVADAPKAMTYRPKGEGAYIPAVDVADGGTYALLRLEDGE